MRIATRLLLPLAALVLLCAGCGHEVAPKRTAPPVKTRVVPGEPGRQYAVRGRYLYLYCGGSGSPTVVFESGLGDSHRAWEYVAPELANETTVCVYDRAGIDYSQLAPKRATAREKVKDLHALLKAARVKPPCVLVGHSYGGMLVHLYAADYPHDVAGVVLVDSAHPDENARMVAALPPPRAGEDPELRRVRAGLRTLGFTNPEGVDWVRSSNEARAAGPLGKTPLVVLTAGMHDSTLRPALTRPVERAWLAMQSELARLSSDSVHVVATQSGHAIQSNLGQPAVVIRAIRAVIGADRRHERLPPCRELFLGPAARCVS
jgi:pimeloyl-ACP methyl ester carboxylesterase